MTTITDLGAELAQLEARLTETSQTVAALDGQLDAAARTMLFTAREMDGLSRSMGTGLRRAFEGVAFDGMRLSDAMRQLGRSMADAVFNTALRPVRSAFGGALAQVLGNAMSGALPFAQGAPFSQGRVMPFAQGGVIGGPVSFPMRGGTGLMGEAGPEAILPLSRGADGRLGVRAAGGGRSVNVTIQVATPDVAGFQRSQGQIAAQMQRILTQGQRYL
ncbi:MAG: phage tail tape measure protein [Paracoccaceae bacterium]